MSPLVFILLTTVLAAGLGCLIAAMSRSESKKPIVAAIMAGFPALVVSAFTAYVFLPEYTHWATGGYIALGWLVVLFGCVAGVAFSGPANTRYGNLTWTRSMTIAILVLLIFIGGRYGVVNLITPPTFYSRADHEELASQLNLQEGNGQAPELDINAAIKVTPSHARAKALAAFPQNLNLGSYLELGDGYLQDLHGKPYYVFAFEVKDRRGFERRGSIIPGYILVDATNKSGSAEWHPLKAGQEIRFVNGALWWWSEKLLDRHVYFEYAVPNNARISELSGMELDDDLKPWYTATVMKPTMGFTVYKPAAFITIDPISGSITEYNLDEVPEWVDRIYPASTMTQFVEWWGDWSEAYPRWYGGAKGLQKKVDDTSLVWGPDGLMLQYVMKSKKGSDNTATDLIYVNLRTGVATRYPIDSATQSKVKQIVEQKAMDTYKMPMSALNCQVEFLAGKSVWYCLLEKEGNSWGVAIVQQQYAKASDATQVIISENLSDAYSSLLTQIAEGESGGLVDNSSATIQLDGSIDRVGNAYFEEGQWYLPFALRLEDGSLLFLRISTEKPSSHFIRDSDSVTVTAIKVTTGVPDTVIEVTNHTYPLGTPSPGN